MMMNRTLPVFIVIVLAAGCGVSPNEPRADLVLTGGTIIDLENGHLTPDQDVWIVGDRIQSITSTAGHSIPAGVETVDVTGRYLVPGLVDAHVHLDHVDELELYTAAGVTSVFNLRGLPRHLRWRQEIARGERNGPNIYTTGDYMDGYPPFMLPMMSFDNPEEAALSVRKQHEAGYDMVKVYSRLTLEQLQAITAVAREVGMPVIGHASENYTLDELVRAGQLNVAHGQELLRWYVDEDYSEDQIAHVIETLSASETTVTVNLSWTDGLIRQAEDLEGLVSDPVAQSLPPAILQPFRRANNRFVRRGVDWLPSVKERFEVEKQMTRRLHEAGVTLLTGTDASTSGVLPGASLLIELELLVEAGLSPLDALRAATVNAGNFVSRHIDAEDQFGRIAGGYRADIVVLNANPLEDVSRMADSAGIVVRGRWSARASIDARLEELAEKSRELTPRVIEIEDGIKGGDLARSREVFDAVRAEMPEEVLFSQYVPFFIGFGYLYGDEGYDEDPENLEAALTLYEMYTETYPSFHSSHYMLALAQEANGNVEAAVESLQRALEIHPYFPDGRQKLIELGGIETESVE